MVTCTNRESEEAMEMQTKPSVRLALLFLVPALLDCRPGWAEVESTDLTASSLENILAMPVTSAAKKSQVLAEVAAPVTVITSEDIRRSGATTIAEVLRMVPGFHVARVRAHNWALSSRGFDEPFANKLLVLQDGRELYLPLFAGMLWNIHDPPLKDIDRIEVVRGPGAAIWGANAVNGVVNIITKSARDTQGAYVEAGGGTEERAFGVARYGAAAGQHTHWRGYVKGRIVDDGEALDNVPDDEDGWKDVRGGFRLDRETEETAFSVRETEETAFSVQGELFYLPFGNSYVLPAETFPYTTIETEDDNYDFGGHLLARWTRNLGATGFLDLQAYYDRRDLVDVVIEEDRNTWDLEFRHRFLLGKHQDLVWGGGLRYMDTETDGTLAVRLDPADNEDTLIHGFAHDEVALVTDKLHLIVGGRLEHNDYSGTEWHADARTLWRPAPKQSLWAGVSRATRSPAQVEVPGRLRTPAFPPGDPQNPLPTFAALDIQGSDGFTSEKLVALQAGYRGNLNDRFHFELAWFRNWYDDLRSLETRSVTPADDPMGLSLVQTKVGNQMEADSWGAEVEVLWRILPWWRIQVAYTFIDLDLEPKGDSTDGFTEEQTEGLTPEHQIDMRAMINLPENVELDLWARWVDDLERGSPPQGVDDYWNLDVRLAWRPRDTLELSVVGQNLLEESHLEFPLILPVAQVPTEKQRGVYAKVACSF
jgi:iron complex outermembrane receptor protein